MIASTGKPNETDYLKKLGASEAIDRQSLSQLGRPLQKERWAGVIDSAGSATLANALAQTRYGGVVAACGLVQGMDLPSTVMPFILRGVTLRGIDSVMAPVQARQRAWERLARDIDFGLLETMTDEIGLDAVLQRAEEMMAGRIRGRAVVRIK